MSKKSRVKVIHVSPTYFDESSIIGGGERFVTELSKALSNYVDSEIIAFGPEGKVIETKDGLKVNVYRPNFLIKGRIANPFSIRFISGLKGADIIHCHQVFTLITNISTIYAKIFKKKVFVTDLGGGGLNFYHALNLGKYIGKFLCVSKSSGKRFDYHKDKVDVIYAGVDMQFFKPVDLQKEQKITCVARIYPHKGQNYLIDAMPENLKLNIIGRVYHDDFYNLLKEQSRDKNVEFMTELSDQELVKEYSTSLATVLPSVYQDVYGHKWLPVPELFGLTLVESMSCGTPVIASDAGPMPEIVEGGKTGFIVPPNDVSALREKIEYFADNPSESYKMGNKARKAVEKKFTWDKVAKRCLKAYGIKDFEAL